MSLLLLRDGTIITLFQHDGSSVTEPIEAQLREPRTLARDSQVRQKWQYYRPAVQQGRDTACDAWLPLAC